MTRKRQHLNLVRVHPSVADHLVDDPDLAAAVERISADDIDGIIIDAATTLCAWDDVFSELVELLTDIEAYVLVEAEPLLLDFKDDSARRWSGEHRDTVLRRCSSARDQERFDICLRRLWGLAGC
jgi:hypothetical protein